MKTLILSLVLIAAAVRPSATPSCYPCDASTIAASAV